MNTRALEGQRIVVMASDIPWPANRGGRADVWRRLVAMRSQGAEVFLVHLFEPSGPQSPTQAHWDFLRSKLDGHFAFPMRRGRWLTIKRLLRSPWLPWHAATRVPLSSAKQQLVVDIEAFRPTAVWLDGLWFFELAELVSEQFRVPLLYRSHNVEHRYLPGQAAAAARVRDRIAWRAACIGLERYEWKVMRSAAAVFDISMDDLAFWRERGLTSAHWLPPLSEEMISPCAEPPVSGDLVFVGNLRTPNNLQGLRWLLDCVMPKVLATDPEATLSVVGSAPDEQLRQRLASLPFVRPHFDAPSVMPYLKGARVLLNPVFTGSGVQLKTLDMLSTDTPIVTRSQGLRGLPQALSGLVRVADTADQYARAVCEARLGRDPWLQERHAFRQTVTPEGVANRIADVLRSIGPRSAG